jgi:hypothetical protein
VLTVNWPDVALNEINTREDLARYLQEPAQHLPDGEVALENPSTPEFVDASARWTAVMGGIFRNVLGDPVPDTPDWAMIAAIFRAATIHE